MQFVPSAPLPTWDGSAPLLFPVYLSQMIGLPETVIRVKRAVSP